MPTVEVNGKIIMERMYLSTNSNDPYDSDHGIFLYDRRKPESERIELLSVIKGGGFRFIHDSMKDFFDIENNEMSISLENAIYCIVILLKNHSSEILGVSNFNFKKCDIIVYACRGFSDTVERQYVKLAHRPRTYLKSENRKRGRDEIEPHSSSSSPNKKTVRKGGYFSKKRMTRKSHIIKNK